MTSNEISPATDIDTPPAKYHIPTIQSSFKHWPIDSILIVYGITYMDFL